ncbi:MAG: calcium/sodium antiporter [Alphaproteobacteria bacterium]
MDYLWAGLGLICLIAGGDILVRGSVSVARHLRVSPMLIGLTVVAFGTSAPELVVSIDAAVFEGVPELALGNAVGSNIANVLLVLGVPALIYPMVCNADTVGRDTIAMIIASIIFVILCLMGEISLLGGLILFVLLVGYMGYSAHQARTDPALLAEELKEIESQALASQSKLYATAFVVGGLIALVLGAELLVGASINIARSLGVSEATIGLTMIALGTSLPELATSVAAALRRNCDVALGNVIGSNMFNLLGVVGITAIITPIPVPSDFLTLNLWVMLAASLLLVPIGLFKIPIGRTMGIGFTIAYVGYIAYLF